MSLQSKKAFSPEKVTVIFRDNKAQGLQKIVHATISGIVEYGIPTDKDGEDLKIMSAKIHDGDSNIFVGNLDTIGILYDDDTMQSLNDFLEDLDGTPVVEVFYYGAETSTYDYEDAADDEYYYYDE